MKKEMPLPHSEILKNILSGKNKSFCSRPFLSVTANQNGAYRLCCEDEKVLNTQTMGNIKTLKIPEMKNGEIIKAVRKKMLEGKQVKECSRCQLKESRGIASLREKSNTQYFHKYIKDIVYSSDIQTGATDHPSIHADIRFSNICNLACRMCYSGSSSSRRELDKRLGNPVHDIVQDIWKPSDFSPILDELKILYIAGGEPFIDKNFEPFLKLLIDSGRSKNIGITVNTNLTIFSETHLDLLTYFKDVRIVASCDGYGDMYEYIRIGAKWHTFMKNIIYVKKNLHTFGEGSGITVNTVVQADNILNILQLYLFCHKIGVKHNLSILQVPENMYIGVIPHEQRMKILKIYEKFISQYTSMIPEVSKQLSEITNILAISGEQSPQLYEDFGKQKEIIDKYMSSTHK